MPTAIVRIVTPDGIVLAADGCATDDDKKRTSDREQKLFSTEKRDSWVIGCGLSELGFPTFTYDERAVKINFREICERAIRIVEMQDHYNSIVDLSQSFTESFRKEIEHRLTTARDGGEISNEDYLAFFQIPKPVRFQFAGYVNGLASVATALLTFCKKEHAVEIVHPTMLAMPTFSQFFGSDAILSVLISRRTIIPHSAQTGLSARSESHPNTELQKSSSSSMVKRPCPMPSKRRNVILRHVLMPKLRFLILTAIRSADTFTLRRLPERVDFRVCVSRSHERGLGVVHPKCGCGPAFTITTPCRKPTAAEKNKIRR
jgi:hypothetical protein